MICVLSQYVEDDIVKEVTSSIHICLYVRIFLIYEFYFNPLYLWKLNFM